MSSLWLKSPKMISNDQRPTTRLFSVLLAEVKRSFAKGCPGDVSSSRDPGIKDAAGYYANDVSRSLSIVQGQAVP